MICSVGIRSYPGINSEGSSWQSQDQSQKRVTSPSHSTPSAKSRELPGAVEGTSYGTPAFRVGKTLFVRQHQDGESLVVKIDPDERTMRMKAEPKTFFITDHYLNYPWILVRLATVARDDLRDLLEDAWRQAQPEMI